MATTLTFRDRIADVTCSADVTVFLHATSGALSLIALNVIWAHFLDEMGFHPILYLLNTLNKTKWREMARKMFVF